MSGRHKSYFDSSKRAHVEAMEATSKAKRKLDSAFNKVQDAHGMLTLIQLASHEDPEILSLAVCLQIDKIVPLLESALKKLDRHGIEYQKLAFKHHLGDAS